VSCPFHEDRTPSLSISEAKGLWHCFSCERGGDGLELLVKARRMGFLEAVRELAP
jgi:DNA primase